MYKYSWWNMARNPMASTQRVQTSFTVMALKPAIGFALEALHPFLFPAIQVFGHESLPP